jgi:regulator of sigma E protease
MTHMIDFLRNIVAFVVTLGILVFVHEMGHYLAARWRGVYVEAFSIGFGRPLASWTDRLGTVWKLSWLPLGGYVKLHGQERPEDVTDEVRGSWKRGMTFHEKSVASRAIIVAAGPIANFVLAVVLFSALFVAVGRPIALPEVGDVVADGAAAQAGLMPGDRIDSIDGVPTPRFEDIQRIVAGKPGRTLDLVIRRDGAEKKVSVVIGSHEEPGGKTVGLLGIRGGAVEYQRVDPLTAIQAGVVQTYEVGAGTLQGVGQMISGSRGTEELSGPLGIMKLSGDFAKLGLSVMVSFIAVLSVNLGLVNLFPIPVLDGGHLLFYLAEALRGRPLPPRMLEYGFRAGFALLAGLFVFATWNDLTHMGLFRWVAGLIG